MQIWWSVDSSQLRAKQNNVVRRFTENEGGGSNPPFAPQEAL